MSYIPQRLRTLAIARARESCEYCLVHADYAAFVHEIDHVIAQQHDRLLLRKELFAAGRFPYRFGFEH